MLVRKKNLSIDEITHNWVNEVIDQYDLPEEDIIRKTIEKLPSVSFKDPLDIAFYLNEKAKNYGSGDDFNINPFIDLAKKIAEACGARDDAQDTNSPFITAYKFNSVTEDMDRVRIPISQILYFIKISHKIPRRAYVGGEANVILNDQNRTELSLIDCTKNNTAEFLLDCYIKSAEEVVTAWTGK
ncbi:hypothetical protein ABEG90_23880 [Pantoea agglomerans]|uniref:hypothetical protein n=1 Tax=Enterobacter agglomerans TaxID=549 RepID=UPI00320B63D2